MKRVFSGLAIAAALTTLLAGCADQVGEFGHKPVYRTVTVKGDMEDLYYKLINEAPKGTVCKNILQNAYFPKRNEFSVIYGAETITGDAPFFGVYGKQVGNTVQVSYRQHEINFLSGNIYARKIPSFIEKGNCD